MLKPRARQLARKSLRFESLEDRCMLATVSISDATAIEGSDIFKPIDQFVAAGSGGLARPRLSAFGPDSNGDGTNELYVASADTDEILRYDGSTGAFLDVFISQTSGGLDGPMDLEFAPDGNLYVSGYEGNHVLRYNGTTGAFLNTVATGLSGPLGLNFGPDGSLYTACQNVDQVLRYDGVSTSVFIQSGSGGLDRPRVAEFGPDGNGNGTPDIYVASEGTGEVLRYEGQTGSFIGTFVSLPSGFGPGPAWMEFGGDGHLYATARTTSTGLETSLLQFSGTTGALIDRFDLGRDGWSFQIGSDGLAYVSGNAAGNIVDRIGASSLAPFTISLSAPAGGPVSASYSTAPGTAGSTDFMATSGTVTFAPGQTSRTILVKTLDDAAPEANETFVVNLSNPVGASIADGQGAGTITDDDAPPTISISDATVNEKQTLSAFTIGNSNILENAADIVFGPSRNGDSVDDLYVAGRFSSNVVVYDGVTGAYIEEFVGPGAIQAPTVWLSLGPNGDLYVNTATASGIPDATVRIDQATKAVTTFISSGSGGLSGAKSQAFGPDGNFYVASAINDQILRYNGSTGAFIDAFVSIGSGGLDSPSKIVFGPDRNSDGMQDLYVSSSNTGKILVYNGINGAPLGAFVAAGSGGLGVPGDMEFGPDGNLYVVDTGTSNEQVYRFDGGTGAFLDIVIPAGSVEPQTSFITFDHEGNIYISSEAGHNVLRYDTGPIISLSAASTSPITVEFATADGTATAGADYHAIRGRVTFDPGDVSKRILIPTIDDATHEGPEIFTVNLSNPVGGVIADGQGVGTIIDDDDLTKFYVVNDATQNRTYEYEAAGVPGDSYNLASGNSAPRGAATTVAGDKVWIVDANRNVYVYDTGCGLVGSWTARTMPNNATIEGIATNGTDVWIVDGRGDRVYRYAGAASRTSGSHNAASSFRLDSGNSTAKDIVTDGEHVWVVNDASTDRVFKYTIGGSFVGSWTIDSANKNPTGITLDPANVSDIWIVDSGTDRVYQYTGAASRTSGSQAAASMFALAPGNTNPQGIADPPSGLDTQSAPLVAEPLAFPQTSTSRQFAPRPRPRHSTIAQAPPSDDLYLLARTAVAATPTRFNRNASHSSFDIDDTLAIDAAFATLHDSRWAHLAAGVAAVADPVQFE